MTFLRCLAVLLACCAIAPHARAVPSPRPVTYFSSSPNAVVLPAWRLRGSDLRPVFKDIIIIDRTTRTPTVIRTVQWEFTQRVTLVGRSATKLPISLFAPCTSNPINPLSITARPKTVRTQFFGGKTTVSFKVVVSLKRPLLDDIDETASCNIRLKINGAVSPVYVNTVVFRAKTRGNMGWWRKQWLTKPLVPTSPVPTTPAPTTPAPTTPAPTTPV